MMRPTSKKIPTHLRIPIQSIPFVIFAIVSVGVVIAVPFTAVFERLFVIFCADGILSRLN